MSNVANRNKAIGTAIDIAKLYAGSANHNVGTIDGVLECVYRKLVELSDDVIKPQEGDQ